MAKKSADAATMRSDTEHFALTILQDKLYEQIQSSGPRKTGELVSGIGHPAVNLSLAKYALRSSSRFVQTQRKWDISARWESPELPFEKLLEGFFTGYGRPLTAQQIGAGMATITERDEETMTAVATKFLQDFDAFTAIGNESYGLKSWLVDGDYETTSDVLFYNFMEPEDVEPFQSAADKADWKTDPAAAAREVVQKAKEPVSIKALQFFAWEHFGPDIDQSQLYAAILADEELGVSSDQMVYPKSGEKKLLDGLKTLAASVQNEVEEEEDAEETPPTITDQDIEEFGRIIQANGAETTQLSDAVLKIFELEEDERAYEPTAETLTERLRHDPRFTWLGAGRFRPAGTVPEEFHQTPETLLIPKYDFATPDGEHFDIEMETAGLESGLSKEIHELLVQDVGDEDPEEHPAKPPTQVDLVLKYHHKQEGTYPLAQVADGFFALEPQIQEIVLRHDGSSYTVWLNRESRLLYGFGEIYALLDMPISGGLFHLKATDRSDVFDLEYSQETDETASVQPGRLLELLQLKEEADTENLPTFEVVCRMLERQSGGLSYPRLFVELNLIRRVNRLLVASLLSAYPCFSRQATTGLWVFDAKKKSQGLQKSKRKYVVREY